MPSSGDVGAVVVTGATSQIGRFLLPRLRAAGYAVFAISRVPADAHEDESIGWLVGDIGTAGTVEQISLPAAAVLIHLAPLRLLPGILPEFIAHGCRRVICFGTTSRYSKAVSADLREQDFASKQIAAEEAVAAACSAAGASWTVFRPTLIYGCELDRNVTLIAKLIRKLGFFPLLGPATGLRQPVHADDLAAACVSAIPARQTFDKAYDLSGGETLSYRVMVTRIFAALNRSPRFLRFPVSLFRFALWMLSLIPRYRDFNGEMARRMNEDLVFDSGAAKRDFNYSPRPFSPEFSNF